MTDTEDHPLSRRIAEVLALAPDSPALEFDGAWHTWGALARTASRVRGLIESPHRVGVLLRNRPEHVAALLGVLLAGGTVVVINPARGEDRIRADIDALDLPLVIGGRRDLETLLAPDAATLAITDLETAPTAHGPRPGTAAGPTSVAVRMLTSGTTGPPKRVDITYDMLARSVLGGDPTRAKTPTEPRRGVAIVNAPLVHIGGVFRVLQCLTEARPFVFLPKFELDRWADAVRRHRPGAVSLVPAALRTVLHSDLTAADLAGVRVVTSGTAPLSAEDADAFRDKFGIPVLTSYAATEFGGGVAGWTLPDHERFWSAKRGSVGRATGGAHLRVVDEAGTELGPDDSGLLEVRPGQLGPDADWIRTTDIARLDADGFLWILGRADQAIIRGGFKIMPDDVRTALESHPAVLGAAVVARPDDRLGQTPVAMVELRANRSVEPTELIAFLGGLLARYEIPTEFALVETIPRTPSGKADLAAVRRHFDVTATRRP